MLDELGRLVVEAEGEAAPRSERPHAPDRRWLGQALGVQVHTDGAVRRGLVVPGVGGTRLAERCVRAR